MSDTVTEPNGQLRIVTCEDSCPHGDDIPREPRWGRPVIDGKPRTRVSTLAGTLADQGNLIAWKARTTLLGATEALLRQAAVADKSGLDRLVEDAVGRAGGGDAAAEGTLMHAHLVDYLADPDRFDWGRLDDRQAEMVLAFGRALDEAGLRFHHGEQFVVGPTWAGTYDLALVDRDGRYWVADIKTGAKGWDVTFPLKVATQLAGYARGARWCPVQGWLPTPEWEGLLLISVPLNKGTADIYRLDASEAFGLLDLALTVRAKRSGQRALVAQFQSKEDA